MIWPAALALTLLVLGGGTSSAAIAPAHGSVSAADVSSSCVGPCPVFFLKKGSGAGRVTSNPPGIDCGVDCTWTFQDGDTITFTAAPEPGSYLLLWENCTPGGDGSSCSTLPGFQGTVCAVFLPSGTSTAPPGGCPPVFPQCDDKFDNDRNGLVDYPADPGCSSVTDNEEYTPPVTQPPPPATWPARCTIPGSPFGEVLRGTSKRDVICAGGGNDRILGGGGNDTIVGGNGRDQMYGGAGDDLLIARDRKRDVVNGGPGRDRARMDRIDRRLAIERRV